jgi:hypothetical protein
MNRTASEVIEGYLARLRSELDATGTTDTEELVAEIRSLLTDAAEGDPERAITETERLGEPAELARGILAERGLDAEKGMAPGVWWRLGIAAPIDIAIGLALPLAAALPLYAAAWFGQPRAASIAIAIAVGLAVLAWPFFIWRPWRVGGRALSPGMTLTGLAVVRAPGSWRLVRTSELASMGLAPRRRVALAVVVALVSVVLLLGASIVGFDVGSSWLATAAITSEFSGNAITGGNNLEVQLQTPVDQVYVGLAGTPGPYGSTAQSFITPEAAAELQALWERIEKLSIRSIKIGTPVAIAPGVYRFEVREYRVGAMSPEQVGSSTFTVGQRQWLTPNGTGSDWAVVGIAVGETPPAH